MSAGPPVHVVWFVRDLRLCDHAPLTERVASLMHDMNGSDDAAESETQPDQNWSSDERERVERRDPFAAYRNLTVDQRRQRLDALVTGVLGCTRCPLSMGRTHSVAGEGVLDPLVMFIGEGPGRDEDESGRPFVGAAGRYLDRWLAAIGLDREKNAYITNIVKCRPPNNRDPQPDETDACTPWLLEQIVLVRPRMIVTLGRISMRVLTGTTQGITRIHGTFHTWRGIPLVPTFHPSAVLRRDEWRRPVWEDLKTIRNWLVDNADHVAPDDPAG